MVFIDSFTKTSLNVTTAFLKIKFMAKIIENNLEQPSDPIKCLQKIEQKKIIKSEEK